MSYSFSGPSFSSFGFASVGALFVGSVYNSLAKTTNAHVILLFKEFADMGLYQLAVALNQKSDYRKKAKAYAATHLIVNIATLVALRHFQLIANIGTAVFASLIAIDMLCQRADFGYYRTIDPNTP